MIFTRGHCEIDLFFSLIFFCSLSATVQAEFQNLTPLQDLPTFQGSSFNSQGSQVRDQGGFLFVAGQPIFIGNRGEILVKVNGNFLPADSNTTSQVLSIYRTWANNVRTGQAPNDARFRIANRALNAPFIRDRNIPDNSNIPSNPNSTFNPSIGSHGSSNGSQNGSSPHPTNPLSQSQIDFNNSIDRNNLRIFQNTQNHLFFMDRTNNNKIFSLNTTGGNKIACQMDLESITTNNSEFKLNFTHANYSYPWEISIVGTQATLTCETDSDKSIFTEINSTEREQALNNVQFRPFSAATEGVNNPNNCNHTPCDSLMP